MKLNLLKESFCLKNKKNLKLIFNSKNKTLFNLYRDAVILEYFFKYKQNFFYIKEYSKNKYNNPIFLQRPVIGKNKIKNGIFCVKKKKND